TWPDLTDLASAGNEVAGHTVTHPNLTDPSLTYDQKVHEVCAGRQALIDHGFNPSSFAYPEGAYDQTAEQIVDSCGFTTARTTGGLTATGPAYSETVPPKDIFATRTQPVSTSGNGPLQLATLQSIVTSGAAHGGGWEAIVFHRVCSQTYLPSDYTDCIGSFHPIELDTLNAFLDWLANAGQPGGAPAGVVIRTVRQVLPARPDTTAPVTTISCNGSPCQGSYGGSVMVGLSATDGAGSGVARTYYTTDGSTPTTASPIYTGPFVVLQSSTVNFFSVDVAGNAEQVQSTQVQVGANPDPVVAVAGDIACDPTAPAFNGGNGTATDCRAMGTSNLLVGADNVLALGDEQYDCGGYQAFQQSYGPTWGRFNSITHPVPGDKEYGTTGTDCPSTPGAGYFQYFGATAGDPSKGYYSYDLGTWHVIALNTGPCPTSSSFCAAGSAEEQWLKSDLAASSSACTLAYFQNPRFASTSSGGSTRYAPLWNDLYAGGADVVMNGDDHWYERFAPMDATGAADPTFGIREFIVGTGGAGLDTPATQLPTSQAINNNTHGIVRLVLRAGGYDWTFVHDTDGTFSDSGTGSCHGAPPPPDTIAPATTINCNAAACSNGWYATSPVTVSLSATDNPGGSGLDKTYYTTDGTTPTTSSTVYAGPFPLAGTATVKFFSKDLAGNAEAVGSQLIRIDPTAPTTTISCAGAPCSASGYIGSVSVSLSATDNQGGSGVAATVYTTDGSDPASSATATTYTGPFAIGQTTTVKFSSKDVAGNAENTASQTIQVSPPSDTTPPTTAITCNSAACSAGWYKAAVTVRLSATDNQGGSGVDKTYFTTDGST
ncbi:MAG TPA: chitobiase/beta-hexosaminidase C-terminal domain-containing protein, partial [Actinomycetota bacterium]|nr:chitobiase/beta-hexosaminidase C-terminal domain-containing protein [Actinomycetota bacterium]